MRSDLPVLHPDDDLIRELQMLTGHRTDLVADRTRTINRLRQQLIAICPGLERVAQISSDRGWAVLLARYQRPKAIRRTGVTRLTAPLAAAGVRNAETIAQAAVTAAKAQTVRLPGEDIAAELVAELAQGGDRPRRTCPRRRRGERGPISPAPSGRGDRELAGNGVPARCRIPFRCR